MIDLSQARILISNDDGIHAPGLKVLEHIAKAVAKEVWVVAPETEQSATGHSLTLRRPLRIHKHSDRRYSVDGTPTDCVLLAMNEIMKDCPPDLVLTGVNRGGNLGEDVTYSGTIAAAMESTLLGVPAIALSQYFNDANRVKWSTAETHGPQIVKHLAELGWAKNTLMNVNFPDVVAQSVKGVEVTRQGRRKIGDDLARGHDPRGEEYFWIGALQSADTFDVGTDLHAVMNGAISISPISLDFTDYDSLKKMEGAFK
ncbi:broad specificity 5'(3')-nucleotidase and polyphosphatase [Candidatus Terasakiella magnetica]|uniref:5'-nucleotidase SurE n=1 Tax=Candidatus Terasakiella magnetica TaxID=1867952 RepID=A0A1C3RCB8_9PROT|nr:5'/3'-nucleotidase SurE [Candidatus Terasakiella magnetica]SCA54923.1 broad specificity 5'(3')-nucleotidase and polyphosphatase [Candidatus Terasakiella magnetica]